jgi:hypothetical protein
MRGRRPVGPELIDRLGGSDEARRRAKVVLQTMSGELRVQEACAVLGLSEQLFEAIRQEAVAGAVARLEPKPVGRPPRPAAMVDAAEVERLKERTGTSSCRPAGLPTRQGPPAFGRPLDPVNPA